MNIKRLFNALFPRKKFTRKSKFGNGTIIVAFGCFVFPDGLIKAYNEMGRRICIIGCGDNAFRRFDKNTFRSK